MRLEAQRAEIQRLSDLAVGGSAIDMAQYPEFASAEFVEFGGDRDRRLFRLGDVALDEAFGDTRREQGFACDDKGGLPRAGRPVPRL